MKKKDAGSWARTHTHVIKHMYTHAHVYIYIYTFVYCIYMYHTLSLYIARSASLRDVVTHRTEKIALWSTWRSSRRTPQVHTKQSPGCNLDWHLALVEGILVRIVVVVALWAVPFRAGFHQNIDTYTERERYIYIQNILWMLWVLPALCFLRCESDAAMEYLKASRKFEHFARVSTAISAKFLAHATSMFGLELILEKDWAVAVFSFRWSLKPKSTRQMVCIE